MLKVSAEPSLLAPAVRDRVEKAIADSGLDLMIFEAWRSPERQEDRFKQGRSVPGPRVTNAAPFFSLHQYGLAVDVVYRVNGQPSWQGDFDIIVPFFTKYGFDHPPSFEKCHFQISNGMAPQMIYQMFQASTTQGVWINMGLT